MLSMLFRAAPVVSEFSGAFFNVLCKTTKIGTTIGVVVGSTLSPIATINELQNIEPSTPAPEVVTQALSVASKTIVRAAAIGFYVGAAPISIPIKCAVDHYWNSHKPT